jgi:hypothetical protein
MKIKEVIDRWLEERNVYKELDTHEGGIYEIVFSFDGDKYDYHLTIEKKLKGVNNEYRKEI